MHYKTLICTILQVWKNYLHLLPNCMHSKTFICRGVWFVRIIYIYWQIECITKLSFKRLFELAIITYINWPIESTLNFSCGRVFELIKITYVYWSIQCIPNLRLLKCLSYWKLLTFLGELNACQNTTRKCVLVHYGFH